MENATREHYRDMADKVDTFREGIKDSLAYAFLKGKVGALRAEDTLIDLANGTLELLAVFWDGNTAATLVAQDHKRTYGAYRNLVAFLGALAVPYGMDLPTAIVRALLDTARALWVALFPESTRPNALTGPTNSD